MKKPRIKEKMLSSSLLLLLVLATAVGGAPSSEERRARKEEDRCPRPDEIAPCQCRTRGPTIQVRCTGSMIGRITEAMMNLGKLTSGAVDVLILEDNNVPHLPSRAFGSVKISRLFLEGNRISTIDRNAFAGIEDFISEIYIKEPSLRVLPRDSVDYLKRLTVLSVEDSRVDAVPRVSGLSRLKLLRVDGSRVKSLPDLGNLPALRYLHVANARLVRLDTGSLEHLSQLVLANFTNNEISWVHPRAFRYMERMQEVSLQGNQLRDAAMVGRAMRALKTLKRLDLSHNQLTELRQASFMDIISLEELDLSHNKLTELQRTAIHRLPRLKVLDLSHNKIESFHSDALKETPMIREVRLSHNALSRISDVSFVMDSLPALSTLDVSDNDVREIPFGALRGYPKLEVLRMARNQISRVSREALADLPSLRELDLSDNRLIADALEGPIFDLPNLAKLDLSLNKLSRLGHNILSNLGNLRSLDVSHNGIASLNGDAFQQTRKLDKLNVSHNSLRDFDPSTFKGLVQLKVLDASHNNLAKLPDRLLEDQIKLKELSLSNNHLQSLPGNLLPDKNDVESLDMTANFILDFPEQLVNRLTKLKTLLFRRNSLQSLGRFSLSSLENLEVLDLHDNRIEKLSEDALRDLRKLKSLDLSLNIIGTVGDTLEPLHSLMKLNLSDNYITSLPRNAFHALRRLSTLDVSNNTIMEIGRAFVDMPELKYLDLSHNHLPIVKEGAFKALPELITLRLDHNSIVELQAHSFQDLNKLEKIVLTKNGIPKIQRETFRDLPSLEVINVDDNLIKKMEARSFVDLYSLKELNLQYNLIDDFDEAAFSRIPSLRHLNMSYNLLRSLPRYGFDGLDSLETIDLSFNDIREVDDRAFDNLPWLTTLKLNDNNICRLRSSAFSRATSLSSLSLSNNRLTTIPEESFGRARQHIHKLEIAGNPLVCDCETLWLRNWATESEQASSSSSILDEPRCYFPKALSGNPLRRLRTSRFTCGDSFKTVMTTTADGRRRRTKRRRGRGMIGDACAGIPLKTPVQAAVQEQEQQEQQQSLENSSPYPYPPYPTNDAKDTNNKLSAVVADPVEPDVSSSENIVDVGEEDTVDVGSDKISSTVSQGDEYYEYYYVYYDEDGNVVNNVTAGKETTNKPETEGLKKDKVQEIKLNQKAQTPKPEKTGDTPTIYAQIKDPAKLDESDNNKQDDGDDGGGLSIFGIPIPKIPISLGLGLVPALSSGLLPLPIGRKGDSLDGEAEIEKPTRYRPQDIHNNRPTVTRGPDTIDPMWVETGLKAASDIIIPQLKKAFSSSSAEEEEPKSPALNVKSSGVSREPQMYNYQHPQNPVIPLSASQSQQQYVYQQAVERKGYYPQGYLPGLAIKFDHPVPGGQPQTLSGRVPVFPPPAGSDQQDQHKRHASHYATVNKGVSHYAPSQKGGGSPRDHINGFRPLFRPHGMDPNFTYRPPPSTSAFPGLDASLNNGFRASSPQIAHNGHPQMQKTPSIQFTSPSNPVPSVVETTTSHSSTIGPAFAAVPQDESPVENTQRPPPPTTTVEEEDQTAAQSVPAREQQALNGLTTTTEALYEDYYEDDTTTTVSNKGNEVSSETEFLELMNHLMKSSTSERPVPTLQIEEVTTDRSDDITSTTERQIPTTTIEIAHRGSPTTMTAADVAYDDTTTNEIKETTTEAATTTTTAATGTEYSANKEKPEYEYEYYYEYYDDEDAKTETTTTSSNSRSDDPTTTPANEETTTNEAAFQNLLGLIQQEREKERPRSGIQLPSLGGSRDPPSHRLPPPPGPPLPPTRSRLPSLSNRPTLPPPIRTSTQLYDVNGNYLESQRSSVTVDSVRQLNPLASTQDFNDLREQEEEMLLASPSTLSSVVMSRRPPPDALRSSSPYPFHPDRLDPRGKPAGDFSEDVNWYYDSYGNAGYSQGVDPDEVRAGSGISFLDTTSHRPVLSTSVKELPSSFAFLISFILPLVVQRFAP